MSDKILMIGAGPVQVAGIQRAREMGLTVVAIDGDAAAPGLGLADVPVVLDVKDIAGSIDIARRHAVRGVLGVAVDVAVPTVAAVAHALGLPGLTPEAARNATNKHWMRKLWSESGVPVPAFQGCLDLAQATAAARRIGFPVVVKPVDLAGSRGVSKVDDPAQLPRAVVVALSFSRSGEILVEEYVAGVEISVEAFVSNGKLIPIALSEKVRTPPPHLLDTKVLFPCEHPAGVQQRAIAIVAEAAAALGLDTCPIHAELLLGDGRIVIVELAARGPGFKVFTQMIPWCSGIDVCEQLIRMSIGETTVFPTPLRRGTVLRFPEAPPGVLLGIHGVEQARRLPGVVELEIYVKPGERVRDLASGADRVGHLITAAGTRNEAEAAMHAAEALLRFDIETTKLPS